jgi:HAD domain in Swiss Army Knife RNA repair proteins
MRIIFLDFDGPIIPLASHRPPRMPMEKAWPACVAALNRITETTGAKIVVSSSWRGGGLKEMAHLLKAWGATGDVIDVTPFCYEGFLQHRRELPRGIEIATWLSAHPKAVSFVILDDDSDMAHLLPLLIHTPFEIGLTEKDADAAIQALMGPARGIPAPGVSPGTAVLQQ